MARERTKEEIEEAMYVKEAKMRAKKESHARVEKRGSNSSSVLRLVLVGIAVLIQVAFFVLLFYILSPISISDALNLFLNLNTLIYAIILVIVVFSIFRRPWNSQFKLSWIIIVTLLPIVGLILYFMLGRKSTAVRKRKKYEEINYRLSKYYEEDIYATQMLEYVSMDGYNQATYLKKAANYCTYKNTDIKYFAEAKDGLSAQVEDLKKAEKFIFMEYHAIENAESFGRIKEVLFEKAAAGVEVRVFYDDMGSIGFLNKKFIKEMKKHGIKCRVFNPLTPIMIFFMNNRDHRKITVIDGKVGYTGGYNLANEYFDVTHPYGEWKDTGIRLEGDAVRSLTLIFLENWNAMIKHSEHMDYDEDIKNYVNVNYEYKAKETKGLVTPYADGPTNGEPIAENVYINLINAARRYCYITTPYLLITDEMAKAMKNAALKGVDIRLITPGIPDKKMIYGMTRSYYMDLAKAGVKIFEYSPGFLHAKQMLVDDDLAVIGTINFDYRSLYHHYENACLLCNYDCLKDMKADFEYMLSRSRDVTEKHKAKKRLSLWRAFMRLFSPLM